MAAKVLGNHVVLPETEPLSPEHETLVKDFVEKYFTDKTKCPAAYHYLFERYGQLLAPEEESVAERHHDQRAEEMKRIVAYKYLIARKWKIADAEAMFLETSRWREETNFHRRPFFPSPVALRGYDEVELMSFFKQYKSSSDESSSSGAGASANEHSKHLEEEEGQSKTAVLLAPRPATERIDLVLQRLYGSYSNAVHKWDKQGHPVVYEMAGSMSVGLEND